MRVYEPAELTKLWWQTYSALAKDIRLTPELAVSVANTVFSEWCRFRRQAVISRERGRLAELPKPATPKQLAFLERHKIPFKPGITMDVASALIDRKMKEWE